LRNTVLDFAGSMAHDQRSPISVVSNVAKNYERILPILLEVYKQAQVKGIVKADLLKKRDFEYINSQYGINTLKHISEEMNAFIDNSLHNLKIAQKAQKDEISPDDFKSCEIYKCLHQLAFNFSIHEQETNRIHINTNYNFSFIGNYVLAN